MNEEDEERIVPDRSGWLDGLIAVAVVALMLVAIWGLR